MPSKVGQLQTIPVVVQSLPVVYTTVPTDGVATAAITVPLIGSDGRSEGSGENGNIHPHPPSGGRLMVERRRLRQFGFQDEPPPPPHWGGSGRLVKQAGGGRMGGGVRVEQEVGWTWGREEPLEGEVVLETRSLIVSRDKGDFLAPPPSQDSTLIHRHPPPPGCPSLSGCHILWNQSWRNRGSG